MDRTSESSVRLDEPHVPGVAAAAAKQVPEMPNALVSQVSSGRACRAALPVSAVLHLQRAGGNRAVAALLSPPPPRARVNRPAVQREPTVEGAGTVKETPGKVPGNTYEWNGVFGDNDARLKGSMGFTISRKKTKLATGDLVKDADGQVAWSLGENKAALETAAGKTALKLVSSLLSVDVSTSIIPGFPTLKLRYNYKALEGKFNAAKNEADLDLIKITGSVDGDIPEFLFWAFGTDARNHMKAKVSVKCSIGLSIGDLMRMKAAFKARREMKAAAKSAAEHAAAVNKQAKALEQLKAERNGLQKLQTQYARQRVPEIESLELERSHLKDTSTARERIEGRLGDSDINKTPGKRKLLEKRRKQLLDLEERNRLRFNKNAEKSRNALENLKKSRQALGEASESLRRAALDVDDAMKAVADLPTASGTIAKAGKESIEEGTEHIAKRFFKRLGKKLTDKLVPGLNVISTAADVYEVGTALYQLATGERKWGFPGEGETEGTAGAPKAEQAADAAAVGGGATGDGAGGNGDAVEAGSAGDAAGAGEGEGAGAPGSGRGNMSAEVKELVDGLFGPTVEVEPEVARRLSEMLPKDITPDERFELFKRLMSLAPGEKQDPYELAGKVTVALDEIRAGKSKANGAGVGAPKSLLPGTREELRKILVYRNGQMELDPKQMMVILDHPFTHPDGLQVRVHSIDVPPTRPKSGNADVLVVPMTVHLQVVKLPELTGEGYPYSFGQEEPVSITFLYSTKRKMWGELDQTLTKKLSSLVKRQDGVWLLKRENATLDFDHAKVRVTRIVDVKTEVTDENQFRHEITLEVVPFEISSKEAGYTGSNGWVRFRKDRPTNVTFGLSESAVPAGT